MEEEVEKSRNGHSLNVNYPPWVHVCEHLLHQLAVLFEELYIFWDDDQANISEPPRGGFKGYICFRFWTELSASWPPKIRDTLPHTPTSMNAAMIGFKL